MHQERSTGFHIFYVELTKQKRRVIHGDYDYVFYLLLLPI